MAGMTKQLLDHASYTLTITHSHTHTLTISYTCCYDVINGIQNLKICSHADSLNLSLKQHTLSVTSLSLIQNAYHAVSTYTHTAKYTCMRVWTMTNSSCFLSSRKEKTLHIWLLWRCSAKFLARRDRSHCWFDLIWVHWRMARRRGEAPQTVDSSAFVSLPALLCMPANLLLLTL